MSNPTKKEVSAILNEPEYTVKYNSYSGTDIQCFFFGDNISSNIQDIDSSQNLTEAEKRTLKSRTQNTKRGSILPFAELQTLTISSTRSFGPVRRLGEYEPQGYKGGARTIAGSMIFAVMNEDVFAAYMKGTIPGAQNNEWSSPSHADEIPEFNILIQGANEYGSVASALLIGVRLTNFGTTFSVDDMFTESTYSYLANHYVPFVEDWQESFFNRMAMGAKAVKPLSTRFWNDQVPINTRNGGVKLVPLEFYNWMTSLPSRAKDMIVDNIDDYLNRYYSGLPLDG